MQVSTVTLPALFDLQVDVEARGRKRRTQAKKPLESVREPNVIKAGMQRRPSTDKRAQTSGTKGRIDPYLNRIRESARNDANSNEVLYNLLYMTIQSERVKDKFRARELFYIFNTSPDEFQFKVTVNDRFKSKKEAGLTEHEKKELSRYWAAHKNLTKPNV